MYMNHEYIKTEKKILLLLDTAILVLQHSTPYSSKKVKTL